MGPSTKMLSGAGGRRDNRPSKGEEQQSMVSHVDGNVWDFSGISENRKMPFL